MEVNWGSDEVELSYPYLHDYIRRMKSRNLHYIPLSYPIGLAAYLADHYCFNQNAYPHVIEEVNESYYRHYSDLEILLKTNDTLKISKSMVIDNNFYKIIKSAAHTNSIKTLSEWYKFLQSESPFARAIGLI